MSYLTIVQNCLNAVIKIIDFNKPYKVRVLFLIYISEILAFEKAQLSET